jgi:hypothetical protein
VLASGTSGDALATVTYSGISATQTFRVYTNEPPRRLCGASCVYVVQVQDAQGAPLDGVLVAITSGHLQGRSAVSSRAGARFEGDIVDGPITVRGTKAGYREWNGSGTVGGNGRAALAPVVMVPE